MAIYEYEILSSRTPAYEECVRRQHPIVDYGGPWFCRVCHERTDAGFAAWSRLTLANAKQREVEAQAVA